MSNTTRTRRPVTKYIPRTLRVGDTVTVHLEGENPRPGFKVTNVAGWVCMVENHDCAEPVYITANPITGVIGKGQWYGTVEHLTLG